MKTRPSYGCVKEEQGSERTSGLSRYQKSEQKYGRREYLWDDRMRPCSQCCGGGELNGCDEE